MKYAGRKARYTVQQDHPVDPMQAQFCSFKNRRPVHQRLQVHVLCIRGCRSTSCASEAAGPRPVHQRLQVHVLCIRGCRSTSCAPEAAGPRPVHQRLQVHVLCIRGCRSTSCASEAAGPHASPISRTPSPSRWWRVASNYSVSTCMSITSTVITACDIYCVQHLL